MDKRNRFCWNILALVFFYGGRCVQTNTQHPPKIIVVDQIIEVESCPLGTILTTVRATDQDGDDIELKIGDTLTEEFVNLTETKQNANGVEADVILKKQLDRDLGSDTLVLRFEATDNSVMELTTSGKISIFILDANDNPPKFKTPFYMEIISENNRCVSNYYIGWLKCDNSSIGSSFDFGIEAEDPDNGNNGTFTFSLEPAGQSAQKYKGVFEIDGSNGKIVQNLPLNYEKLTFYQYQILATDKGNPQLTGTADITIKIQDVQDTPPYFQGLPYRKTVHEEQQGEILHVEAFDGDAGVPNPREIEYSIQMNNSQCPEYFDINPTNGIVSIVNKLDADAGTILENQGFCSLLVQASEIGVEKTNLTTATTIVTITVLDIDDNLPSFSHPVYEAEVAENSTNLAISIKGETGIFVEDKDQVNFNAFDLMIEHENGTMFHNVVPTPSSVRGYATLQIRLQNGFLFDFEKEQHTSFMVIATENHDSIRKSNCTVNLNITNLNDNYPVFSQEKYNTNIYENSPNGTSVIQITATDADSGHFGEITYSLRGTNGILSIDVKTGRIFTICDPDALDREKRDEYYFTVEAKDGGGVSTSAQLVVSLNDTNDNPPVFVYRSYDVTIRENALLFSTNPFQILATDNDAENTPNSNVVYDIDAGYLSENFTIDRTTGIISLPHPLDYEQLESEYIIIVASASDQGNPVQTNLLNITVRVQDENDNTPFFEKAFYKINIPESTSPESSVFVVNATDEDGTPPNNEVSYSFVSGSLDRFRIDRGSGLITIDVGVKLDRETNALYNITIIAIDRGSPARSGTTTLFVEVTDVNDENPKFIQDNIETSCLEDIVVNTRVANCTASDPDENSVLLYSIISVEGRNSNGHLINESIVEKYFNINKDDGTVYVASQLDRETVSRVVMKLLVKDIQGVTEQTATSILTINIQDVNDEPPEFLQRIYIATVSESAIIGTNVVTVKATDVDIGAQISYNITEEYLSSALQDAFKVHPETGTIITNKVIDREEDPVFNITVSAFDGVHKSKCLVVVSIQDVNDNYPQFVPHDKSVAVIEGNYTDNNKIIITVKATDKDEIQTGNGNVTYQLQSIDPNIFQINETTGEISVIAVLDREYSIPTNPFYTLTIIASDNPVKSSEKRTNTTTLTVAILDINDNRPTFVEDSYETSVLETVKIHTTVMEIVATDTDSGQNGTQGIRYNIDNNTGDSGFFFIKTFQGKGILSVAQNLIDKPGTISFHVIATDGGDLSSSQNVTIEVIDVNNNAPIFETLNSTYSIYEVNKLSRDWVYTVRFDGLTNFPLVTTSLVCFVAKSRINTCDVRMCAKKDTLLTTIVATDEDKGKNAEIIYSFLNETSSKGIPFHIKKDTGEIYLAENHKLDYETLPTYTVRIIAQDQGEPVLSTQSGPITIQILDVNDSPPEFDEEEIKVNVKENLENLTIVTVKATDKDSVPQIEYNILESDWYDYFHINTISGDVTLVKGLDWESKNEVTITINATDATMTGNLPDQCNLTLPHFDKTQQRLVVSVIDVDDNPPVFVDPKSFGAGVRQQREGGKIQEVFNLQDKVTDLDSSENSVHTYVISGEMTYSQGLYDKIKNLKPDNCPKNHEPSGPSVLCLSKNGTLSTNMLFDTGMDGHISIPINVFDNGGNDSTVLKVFFIADSQIAQITFGKTKEDVRKISQKILSAFSNLTNHHFVFDGIQEAFGHTIQNPRSRLLFHVVEPGTERILSSDEAISLVDSIPFELRYKVTDEFGAYAIQKLQSTPEEDTEGKSKQLYILGAAVTLEALVLVVVVYFACNSSSKYKRKLKAASINSSVKGSTDKKENVSEEFIPGSNIYAATKNPLLNKEIKIPKADEVSIKSTNSLDANEVGNDKSESTPVEEKEAILDMYGDDYYTPDLEIDALQLVLQDYERISEEKASSTKEETDIPTVAVNPLFDLETTDV